MGKKKSPLFGEIAMDKEAAFRRKYRKQPRLIKEVDELINAHLHWFMWSFLSVTIERDKQISNRLTPGEK
jgi:hypothetical protein